MPYGHRYRAQAVCLIVCSQRVIPQFPISLRAQKIYPKKMWKREHDLEQSSELLTLNKRMLDSLGIWPKSRAKLRFTASFLYILIHVILECVNFSQSIGNLQEILANLSESATYTLLLIKMVIFHNNHLLSRMIDDMNEDCANNTRKTMREQRLYGVYKSMTRNFYKVIIPLVFSTAVLYYIRPLAKILFAKSENGTTPHFALPYRTPFYEVDGIYRYVGAYMYQAVTLPLVTFGLIGSDGLLVSLTLHVCGEMSVLAENIVNLKINGGKSHHIEVSEILKRHLRLIRMAKNINIAFASILMIQLLQSPLLIILNGFNVIVNSATSQGTNLITFALYEASMLSFLYTYCFIGECLSQESKHVRDAFYQCAWYDMPPSQSKDFIICIARSQKTLNLTAGKFYVLSLENFTRILKTSMAYLSVLRTLCN